LFEEKIIFCSVPYYEAGVPMLFMNDQCWIGKDLIIYALDKEIQEQINNADNTAADDTSISDTSDIEDISPVEQLENEQYLSSDKKNTQILLASVLAGLALLCIWGYFLEYRREKAQRIFLLLLFSLTPLTLLPSLIQQAHAICPVCTVAVGAGLGLSRYLGIDDTITGTWIGGLIVSSIFWIVGWLEKRGKKSEWIWIITSLLTYASVMIPLYLVDMIGHPFNKLCGIDKIILSVIVGSIFFFSGAKFHFFIKKRNNDQVLVPFQKVIVPTGFLWLASVMFYFIIY
jgi:hypothetical protein